MGSYVQAMKNIYPFENTDHQTLTPLLRGAALSSQSVKIQVTLVVFNPKLASSIPPSLPHRHHPTMRVHHNYSLTTTHSLPSRATSPSASSDPLPLPLSSDTREASKPSPSMSPSPSASPSPSTPLRQDPMRPLNFGEDASDLGVGGPEDVKNGDGGVEIVDREPGRTGELGDDAGARGS
ncbi:hypothetical protein M427DRAFT_130274 [Gonapodya prolifera JEL478]|uniref:Uncharacterized protein n=1 Tax=Gonapodya prolifera (strain JEL478) TaxID=1344416 RepID=A0A139AXM9_GONPJ|nr:hypothetical protein M427DRAFT_130274 [Gonapodya prolifera JEL478]|eukprot:KXS21488.1 hypothetical protein M427DRAFT_130274 [Gonapodya prolifera JEL478]